MIRFRWCAVASASLAAVGTFAIGAAVAATAAWFGYVSEAGAPGAPLRALYRLGIAAVAGSLALLAVALVPWRGTAGRLAGMALAVAAPLALTSGVVSCSPGCPLPPYESPTIGDLIHAGASISALGLAAIAMLLLGFGPDEPAQATRLRRLARRGAGLTVPLLVAVGLALFMIGRGYITGVLERVALGAALGWLLAFAVTLARAARRR